MAERPKLSLINYRQGMYIILEGTHDSDRFYIIQQGSVRITQNGETAQNESSATLGPGDFFGVIAAMAQKSQIETIQAVTQVSLIAASRSQFEGLIQFNTPIAMKIIQQFSRRIRYLNSELARVSTHTQTVIDDPEALFETAEYYLSQRKTKIAVYAYKCYAQYNPNGFNKDSVMQRLKELAGNDAPHFKNGNTPFVRHYMADSPVFLDGELGDELFIIQTGSVKITKIINDEEVIIALLKPGDIFGEMAILESKPRSASAITFENSILMVVQKRNFENMAATQPQMIARLTKLLAERIWFLYKQLENASITDHMSRCMDYLLIQLERLNVPLQERMAYTFSFGPEELARMTSVPENAMRKTIREILQNGKISVLSDGNLYVSDVIELVKLSNQAKKAQAHGLKIRKL